MTEITTATGYLVNGHIYRTREEAEARVQCIRASKLCPQDDALFEGSWPMRDAIVVLDRRFPGLIDFMEQQEAQSDDQ